MKKRLLAALLSACMLISLLPFSAFAYDAKAGDTTSHAITVPSSGDGIVTVDGENFYVFDENDFAGATFTTTLKADSGIDTSKTSGTKYIGVRIKIEDEHAAYYFQNSAFTVSVKINGVSQRIDAYMQHDSDVVLNADGTIDRTATSTNVVVNSRKAANYFVDFKDASLTKFANNSGVAATTGVDSTGDVDGIMLFPLSNNEAVTEAALATGFEGITFEFIDREGAGSTKASSWDDKTVYIGDVVFVDDYDAFYEANVKGKTKYNLNDGSTATTFTKISPFRSFYRNHGVNNKVGTDYLASGSVNASAYNVDGINVHISTLPNGDRAAAVRYNTANVPYYTLDQLNAGTTPVSATYNAYVMDSYRNSIDVANTQYDKKGLPVDSKGNYEIDLTNSKYIVVRMSITGGNENAWVMWNFGAINVDGQSLSPTAGAYDFIDIDSGETTALNLASSRFTTTGTIDGYLVIPFTMLNGTINAANAGANIRFMQFILTRGFYDGKTMYVGDTYFVENLDAFKKAKFPPEIEYSATNTSITVTNAPTDGSVEYSFNGGAWGSTTTFTGLTKDTKYTLSARYVGYKAANTIDAWTSPYSTHLGDTASYLMNVYDKETTMSGSIANGSTTTAIWSANNDFARNASGVYGNNQRIYVKELDGETFIELDMDEAKLDGNAQIRIHFNAFYGSDHAYDTGVPSDIDTTDTTYIAYRVKLTGGTDGVASRFGFFYGDGKFGPTNLQNGAYVIDYDTREMYTPENWTSLFEFDGEFDGWIVVPFTCMTNSSGTDNSVKDIILGNVEGGTYPNTAVRDIQVIFYHNGTTTDWTNRNLYVGDVLILDNSELFNAARLDCGSLGHEYKATVTAPTCAAEGYTTYKCVQCGHSYVTDKTAKLDHSWSVTKTVDATCTEDGTIYSTCSGCGATKETVIEAIGHNYESTSSYNGTVYTCTNCGDSFIDGSTGTIAQYDGKLGLGIYHLPGWNDNYTTNGVNTDADKLREFEDILECGYNNSVIIGTTGTNVEKLFADWVELCKKYNVEFWVSTRLFEADKMTIDYFINHHEYFINIIKEKDAWNLFLGFHWDEPMYNGCTNSDIYTMTKALYEKWGKRNFPVFCIPSFIEGDREERERLGVVFLESWACEYITDAGWDWYSMDTRESAKSNTALQNYVRSKSNLWGATATTADELYRWVHQQLVNVMPHDFNTWFFPAAFYYNSATGRIDEGYAQGHLEYFANLLKEQKYQGGLFVYGFETFGDRTGLCERLPVLNDDGVQELYPDSTKWTEYSADLQALKSEYDETFVSRINPVNKVALDVTDISHDSISYYPHAGLVYSIDGLTWGTAGIFEGLSAETAYTIYVKDTVRNVTTEWTVTTTSTEPYATGKGDTGSYALKMDPNAPKYCYFQGHISHSINRTLDDSAFLNGSGYLAVKNIDGETFIEIRNNNAEGSLNLETSFGVNGRSKYDMGIPDKIDTSKLTAFALRIKTTGGSADQLSMLSIALNTMEPYGMIQLQLVDDKTGEVTMLDYNNGLKITDNIDGWLILPFNVWEDLDMLASTTNKQWIEKYFNNFYFVIHEGECTHVGSSSWDNDRRLYLGDILYIEDATSFSKARKEIVLPTVSATCGNGITLETSADHLYSIDGITWSADGVFTGLASSTTYTIYVKIAGTDKVESITATTGTSHTYSSKTIKPTCTEQGYTLMTCKVCGSTRQTKFTDPTGHTYGEGVVTAPTCTTEGFTTYTCANCGESYVDNKTAVADHSYGEGVVTAPTCTTEGYTTYTCSVCGHSYVGDKTAVSGHSYTSVVTPPTTTTQGYTTHTCSVCGDTYKDNYTPATGGATNAINLQAIASDTGIIVTWEAPEGVTKYNYYLKNSAGETLVTRSLAADKTSMTLTWPTDVEWGETYSIGIRPYTTKWQDTVYVTSALELGDRIVDIKTESVGRTIEVTWQAYEGATQYYVYVYEKGAYPTSFSAIKATTNKVTIINAIYAEVDYEVRVVATKGVDKMYTVDAIPVAARLNVFNPDVFIERGITPNAVGIAWDEIRGVDKVWVYLNRVDGTGTEIIRESKGSIVGVYNLAVNTEYTVQIQARITDADGKTHYSGKSAVLGTISTNDWEDIEFKAVGTSAGAELTWNAHTNALRYYIYRSTNGGSTYKKIATLEDPTAVSYTDAGAKNGYRYAIQVQVKDDYVASKGTMIKSEAIVK